MGNAGCSNCPGELLREAGKDDELGNEPCDGQPWEDCSFPRLFLELRTNCLTISAVQAGFFCCFVDCVNTMSEMFPETLVTCGNDLGAGAISSFDGTCDLDFKPGVVSVKFTGPKPDEVCVGFSGINPKLGCDKSTSKKYAARIKNSAITEYFNSLLHWPPFKHKHVQTKMYK